MSNAGKRLRKSLDKSKRLGKHHFVTRSGNKIKLHRTIKDRFGARRDAALRKKAAYFATLPKGKVKRLLYRLQPKRVFHYWWSREGLIMALKLAGIGTVAGFLILVGVFAYFRKDLPNLHDISGNNIGGSVRYYDKSGQTLLWEDYDAVKRIPVKEEEISQFMKDATVAVEDKDFFQHGGFDVRGIARAGFNNAFNKGGNRQGGSTLTQQLVRLTQSGVGKEQTYKRKIKELILSIELERSYTKRDILTGYLNAAPYGGIDNGVEAAARDDFDKSAKDLTLDEAAMLATIPQSPRYYYLYSADFDKESFTARQHYILDLMVQQGKITPEQRDEAKKVDTLAKVKPRKPKFNGIKAPWFVLAAKEQFEQKPQGATKGGYKVTTSLDLGLQAIAEDQVTKGLVQVRRQGGDSAAFVAEDVKTGQVVALVGGSDFNNEEYGKNNYARLRLPPGSSVKPYDYTALIETQNNVGAGSVLYDTQGPLEGYACTDKGRPPPKGTGNCMWDYDFRFPGPVTLRYALGGSRNIPAVKAMLTAGIDKTREIAEKLGVKSGYKCYEDKEKTKESPCYASSAIGDGAYLRLDEHVHAYSSISRNGRNLPQTYILKIEDANSKVVDEWKPTAGEQAVREDAAYIVADMLSDPNASYFPDKIHRYKGWKFGLKTGTTNDAKDGWLMGFSTQYAAGVWVGYHTNNKAMSGFMENMTRPIWNGWMTKAHENLKPEDREKPKGVQTLPAFVVRSHVGIGSVEPSPANDLFPSWYQQPQKAKSSKQTIDIVSNKLATDCTPARAKKDQDNAAANAFSADRFYGAGSSNNSDKDDIHKCSDVKPSITLTAPDSCTGSCTFTATVTQGTHALSSDQFKGTLNFKIADQIVQSYTVDNSPSSVSFDYTVAVNGSQTVTAEIVDSVLYDATDSTSVNFTSGGGGSLTLQGSRIGTSVNFTWSGGGGTSTTVYKSDNSVFCSGGSGSGGACGGNALPGTSFYAKDNAGHTSSALAP